MKDKFLSLIKELPLFEAEVRKPEKIVIYTPFENTEKDKIRIELVWKEQKPALQISPFSIWQKIREIDRYYLKELEWRFEIQAGFEKQRSSDGKEFEVPYFQKETSLDSFIQDIYKLINAWLFIEGLISRDVFKPATREGLIDAIVDMIGQGIYDSYTALAFQGKFSKTEEEIDREIEAKQERLYKELQNKTEEELWQILEEKAKQIIPVIDEKVNSGALTAYKNALMLLAQKGRFRIISKGGKVVTGKWIEQMNKD